MSGLQTVGVRESDVYNALGGQVLLTPDCNSVIVHVVMVNYHMSLYQVSLDGSHPVTYVEKLEK